MTVSLAASETYVDHSDQWELIDFLQSHFLGPQPEAMVPKLVRFLQQNPIALEDFPRIEGKYSRTLILRHESGFEAMMARWSKGVTTPMHGHPWFSLYCVIHGTLNVKDYEKTEAGLVLTDSRRMGEMEVFYSIGERGQFDNNIHVVHASEEALSLHLSSDDSAKGEVYS